MIKAPRNGLAQYSLHDKEVQALAHRTAFKHGGERYTNMGALHP
jgi:hypothetical protein